MKALIIGGGIAGYATALSLQKFGIEYELFEAQSSTARQGAGIWLAPNALRVIENISSTLIHKIKEKGFVVDDFGLTFKSGKKISLMNMATFDKVFGYRNTMIHRNDLQAIFESEIHGKIHFGKQLKSITSNSVDFEDGSTFTGDLIIGCDGVGSKTRQNLFSKVKERVSKQTCWRVVADYIPQNNYQGKFYEQIGEPGLRAAYAPINENQVYFYGTAIVDEVDHSNPKPQLNRLFGDFPYDINGVIHASRSQDWIVRPISDFAPIPNWYNNNTVLVGDAAHAMTPNMGQGGNQAIESAYVIALCLSNSSSIQSAFEKYQTTRKPVVDKVIQQSWQFGKLIEMKPQFIRNIILKTIAATPERMMLKNLEKLYKNTYL